MSLLPERQRNDLYASPHRHLMIRSQLSILDFLSTMGYTESFEALKQETNNPDFVPDPKSKYGGLLEKKWTSVIRLQKKAYMHRGD
jgi:platelet-activating factor acetylhydrolase IB subunit alpha